jgi:hypothetical protein
MVTDVITSAIPKIPTRMLITKGRFLLISLSQKGQVKKRFLNLTEQLSHPACGYSLDIVFFISKKTNWKSSDFWIRNDWKAGK